MSRGNLFDLPAGAPHEVFDTLHASGGVRIERIVSTGQSSPPGFWYEQADDEWVVLLSGSALLRFEDEADARPLQPGDWVFIAAGNRHRVDATAEDQASVWLAVHLPPAAV